jgi:hypothetical protein
MSGTESAGSSGSAPLNRADAVDSDLAQLMSRIASLPNAEHLALRAYQQMTQACAAGNRDYPKKNDSPTIPSHTPLGFADSAEDLTSELQRLIISGTHDANETRKLGLVALVGMLQHWPETPENFSRLVRDLFWLECESRLSMLTLLSQALDSARKSRIGTALHDLVTSPNGGYRGDRCLALVWSRALQGDSGCQATILELSKLASSSDKQDYSGEFSSSNETIRGRILSAPRGPVATALAAFTGWMFVRYLLTALGWFILGYRSQTQLNVSERGLEIHEQTSILGCKLRERTRIIALQTVRSLSREVRYARAGLYAGLVALAVGSFVGMRLFVDGMRAPGFSSPTVLVGLLVVLAGIGLDFACANWLEVSRSQCRLLVETVRGRGLYLKCEEPSRVNSVLLALAAKLA